MTKDELTTKFVEMNERNIQAFDGLKEAINKINDTTDTLSVLDNGITRLTGKLLSLTIGVSSVIRRYLNGLLVNPWTKVVKTVATFLKIAKPTATYTKTAKPSNTGIWTKVEKPY